MNQKAHAISNNEVTAAMGEMKEAMNEVVEAAGHMIKNIDWKEMAPKVAAGLVLLYSIRNGKMIGILTSLAIAGASSYIGKITEAKKDS